MIRPDIRTYHDDWGERLHSGSWLRDHFLGRSPRSYYKSNRKHKPAIIRKVGVLFELDLALPGFRKDEIEVNVTNNILTVTAQKTHQESSKNKYIVNEFDVDITERKFELANIVSHDKINAKYQDGMLKLTFEDFCEVNEPSYKRIMVN